MAADVYAGLPHIVIAKNDTAPAGGEVAGAVHGATGQVTIDTTSGGVQIVDARPTRRSVLIVNHGSVAVYISYGDVSTSTGVLLPGTVGAALTLQTTLAVKAIVATGSQVVSYAEEWD